MRILTVIPIAKGIGKDTLTYFTKDEAPIGSIVSMPLRKKSVYGLVVASREATEVKSELKSLSYSLKKIENLKSTTFLSEVFVRAAQKIADYHASTVGAVLSALIPTSILENSADISYTPKESPKGVFFETLLLQSEDKERYATYKSLIREEFAKGRSVFFCLPTTEDLRSAESSLEKGIEKYTHTIHGGLSKKEILSTWQKIISETHPVLIIATGSFLSIPKEDIGTIILEKESSRAYKMQTRPFVDLRTAAEIICKEKNIHLVLGDMLLRTETLFEGKSGKYAELSPLKFRSLSSAHCELLSMRETHSVQDAKKPARPNARLNGEVGQDFSHSGRKEFSIFHDSVKDMLLAGKENNERTFVFCGRKGLFPTTVCNDCGTLVLCKNCNAPVVLYGKPATAKSAHSKNLFVCHHCGERRDAAELCRHCNSWRLTPLGLGIDRVVEELEKLLPGVKIIVMDKDHVSTHKQAVKERDLFYNTPGAILVGTEMALVYLNQKVENTVVASLDSFFSIPDFRINEKVFHILLTLRSISEKNMLVQTRQENGSSSWRIFDYALRGNLMDFYREEVEERKAMGYPPFATFIKLTLIGEKTAVKKEMQATAELLKPFELSIFEAWLPGAAAKYTLHGLISLPKGRWVEPELLTKLRGLSPKFLIKIDPDTLL